MRYLLSAVFLSAFPFAAAAGFNHTQTLSIDGKPAYLAETSARILGNQNADAPELVEDITDGLGKRKIPGYKLMVMGRTYSVAAETKPPKNGQTLWRENTYIHRGIKLFLGIPVNNGKMNLAEARLINIGVIDDDGGSAPHMESEKIRPVGKQLMSAEAEIVRPYLQISALELPDMKNKDTAGGGIRVKAGATINGKAVSAEIDSSFARFYTANPKALSPFKADARFIGN